MLVIIGDTTVIPMDDFGFADLVTYSPTPRPALEVAARARRSAERSAAARSAYLETKARGGSLEQCKEAARAAARSVR